MSNDVPDRVLNARFDDLPPNCKLTPNLLLSLKTEIARGIPLYWARKLVGICGSTYHTWYDKGKESDDPTDPYNVFYLEMEEAKALAVGSRVEGIRKAGEMGSWQAHAWWLERIDNEHFGRKSVVDANVNANVQEVNLAELFDKNEIKNLIKEEEDKD